MPTPKKIRTNHRRLAEQKISSPQADVVARVPGTDVGDPGNFPQPAGTQSVDVTPTSSAIDAMAADPYREAAVARYERDIASQVAQAMSVQPSRLDVDAGASPASVAQHAGQAPMMNLADIVARSMATGPRR